MRCREATGGDEIERRRREAVGQHVTFDVVHIARVRIRLGCGDTRVVVVDSYDFGHQPPQFACQRALAAADVQRSPAARRDGVEDHRVVVRVVVPAD
jgi:hypothetical protein